MGGVKDACSTRILETLGSIAIRSRLFFLIFFSTQLFHFLRAVAAFWILFVATDARQRLLCSVGHLMIGNMRKSLASCKGGTPISMGARIARLAFYRSVFLDKFGCHGGRRKNALSKALSERNHAVAHHCR